MPEIGTSSSMSGDGKRSVGHRPQATAPVLDSTVADEAETHAEVSSSGQSGRVVVNASFSADDPLKHCRSAIVHCAGPDLDGILDEDRRAVAGARRRG
jgi:hypothetical protein